MIAALVVAIVAINVVGYRLILARYFHSMERREVERRLRNVTQ